MNWFKHTFTSSIPILIIIPFSLIGAMLIVAFASNLNAQKLLATEGISVATSDQPLGPGADTLAPQVLSHMLDQDEKHLMDFPTR